MTKPHFRIENGYLCDVEICHSPNYDERPLNVLPRLIVIHSISLPPGEFGGSNVHQLFTNELDFDEHPFYSKIRGLKVSSHFFLDRLGRVTQFVSCLKRAWHAGESEWRGESNCNNFSIGIELEGADTGGFASDQYASLKYLCLALVDCYPIEAALGHSHIALPKGRKQDPGDEFNWAELSGLGLIETPS